MLGSWRRLRAPMERTVGGELSPWSAAVYCREHDRALSHSPATRIIAQSGSFRTSNRAVRSRARIRDVSDSLAVARSQARRGLAVRTVLRAGWCRAIPHRVRPRQGRSVPVRNVHWCAGDRSLLYDRRSDLDVHAVESAPRRAGYLCGRTTARITLAG